MIRSVHARLHPGGVPANRLAAALLLLTLSAAGCDDSFRACRDMCLPRGAKQSTFSTCVCVVAQPDGGK